MAARIAPVTGVDHQSMAATNELVANLHTELNAAPLELQQVCRQQETNWDNLDGMTAIIQETDAVPRPERLANSPPHEQDPSYGSAKGRTIIG